MPVSHAEPWLPEEAGTSPVPVAYTAFEVPIEWNQIELGHLDPCGFPRLPPGHTVIDEVVIGRGLPPGEYEVFAFWEDAPPERHALRPDLERRTVRRLAAVNGFSPEVGETLLEASCSGASQRG